MAITGLSGIPAAFSSGLGPGITGPIASTATSIMPSIIEKATRGRRLRAVKLPDQTVPLSTERRCMIRTDTKVPAANLEPHRMAKPDLPNFSIPARIAFGIVAILMTLWLLRLSGIV
jgi:hypothetical protein